jgi:hypothetical protein
MNEEVNMNRAIRRLVAAMALLVITALSVSRSAVGAGVFRFEESEGNLLKLFDGDQPVLWYNFGMMMKEGAPEKFRRSSYVHPIYGLDGEVLTDDFPKDHYHHRGLFWAWVRVEVDGKAYDPWAVSGMLTKFQKWLGRETGADFAAFGVENGWYVGEQKVVDEKVRLRVGRADGVGRAIDVELVLEAVGKPVPVGGTLDQSKGYGGFGLRFAPRQKPVVMTMSDGAQPGDVIRKVSPWADYSAQFEGAKAVSGAAIFVDKGNPGFPNGWLLREYGYIGLTWPGLETYVLEPGKPLTLRYRVWVHRGDVKAGRVAEAYEVFAK